MKVKHCAPSSCSLTNGTTLPLSLRVYVFICVFPHVAPVSVCPQFTVDNPKGQKTLLGAFEIIVGKEHPELLPRAGHVLKAFYDEDILEEEVLLEWADKVCKKFNVSAHCPALSSYMCVYVKCSTHT